MTIDTEETWEEKLKRIKKEHPGPKTIEYKPEEPDSPPWFLKLPKFRLPRSKKTFITYVSEALEKKEN